MKRKNEYLKKIPWTDNFTNTSPSLLLMYDPQEYAKLKTKAPLNFRQSVEIVAKKSKFGRSIILT